MKSPSFSKLRLLPITPRMLRSGVRRLRCFCWAFCAASFLLFSVVSRAELTQDQLTQAIRDALELYNVGDDNGGLLATYPTDDEWMNLAFLLQSGSSGSPNGVGQFTKDTRDWIYYGLFQGANNLGRPSLLQLILTELQELDTCDTNLVEFLRPFLKSLDSNSTSIDGHLSSIRSDVGSIYDDVVSISSLVSYYGSLWDNVRDGGRWRVHDADLQSALVSALSNMGESVDGISGALGGISESSSGMQDTLSGINERLSGINQNWLTKDQLQNVIDSADEPPHDEPPDDSADKAQAEQSAQYEWKHAESTSYSNKWELASWEYTQMLPGNASIVSQNPADNPGGTGFAPDDSGFPLFSRLVDASDFGMSIDSSTIEPNDYPVFMSYYNEFRVRWGRIFHAVWDFIGAFMVFFIARREWKYYMGVGDNSPEVETDAGGIF